MNRTGSTAEDAAEFRGIHPSDRSFGEEDVSCRLDCLIELHLAVRVEHALHATGYWALRTIAVSVHGRSVTLAGRVPTYYLKQVAQAAALGVPGILQVRNALEVV